MLLTHVSRNKPMQFRAIIFDIYGTLLEVSPAPSDAEARWQALCKAKLKVAAPISLTNFGVACDKVITREHAIASKMGIEFPEVYWPGVACEVLPALTQLSGPELDDFLFQQARLWHTVRLFPCAARLLSRLSEAELLLGLASNCQPYTLRELDTALVSAGLSSSIFKTDLCFFSFAHGFAKPNPHVVRLLVARLRTFGVSPPQVLMVGDRIENDIDAAKAQGFCTWRLTPSPITAGRQCGDWEQLAAYLKVCKVRSGLL